MVTWVLKNENQDVLNIVDVKVEFWNKYMGNMLFNSYQKIDIR